MMRRFCIVLNRYRCKRGGGSGNNRETGYVVNVVSEASQTRGLEGVFVGNSRWGWGVNGGKGRRDID